jgi:Ca2+-binding EF-hand superfamily protein
MNFPLTFSMFYFSFERELKNKLSEKTRGAQSEAQVLMKAFKYFDLNDNGVVEPDEFAKAIEKIGIQIPTRQVSYQNFYTAHLPIVYQFDFSAYF